MFSVNEAASKMGISPVYCRRLLRMGMVKGKKLGHDWVVLGLDYKRRRRLKTRRQGYGKTEDKTG